MRSKILVLVLLLSVSAFLSANVHYAAAQHRTLDFVIDPCTGCKIRIANGSGVSGTINTTYTNGQSASFEDGVYKVTAITNVTTGYTFTRWNYTAGLSLSSNVTNPSNLTVSGVGTSTLTAMFSPPSTTIQPSTILFLTLITATLPVMLRRTRRQAGRA